MNRFPSVAHWSGRIAAPILALALAGCGTPDPGRIRSQDADAYQHRLRSDTEALLSKIGKPLTLDDCRGLARERSLRLMSAALEDQLARINRQMMFSAFLPQIEVGAQTMRLSEPSERFISGGVMETQDQSVRQGSVRIAQPIFAPTAWLMYASARRGENIRRLATERAAQVLDLQIIQLFYAVTLISDRMEATRRAQASATELCRESEALFRAGLLREADLRRAQTLRAARGQEASALARQLDLAKSRLLEAMNLWPMAAVDLDTASLSRSVPELETNRSLEDWMYTALTNRLELFAGDRTVELRKSEMTRAIALFLPNLTGFANFYTTTDSYTVNDQYWGAGLQGVWAVFSGFRSVHAYRAARALKTQAMVQREEQSLAIMVQTLEAWKALQDADGQQDVARRAAEAARLDRATARAAFDEGTASFSVRLQAEAAAEAAEAALRGADCAKAVACHLFRDVVGLNQEGPQ